MSAECLETDMGEAKRRQTQQEKPAEKTSDALSWFPITEQQMIQFYKIANKGAWIGIIIVAISWVTIRFIGPLFGLWEVQY